MQGVITKKDWWQVVKCFGWKKALKLICSREPVALMVLIS